MALNWIESLDAPTFRAATRIEASLFKLLDDTQRRLAIVEKRWDWLQDAVAPLYDTDEEDSPRGERLINLCARAEQHYQEFEWRAEQLKKMVSMMEEITESVSQIARKPDRDKRLRAARSKGE